MIRALTPLAFVASVPRSIEFYQRLGFTLGDTFSQAGSAEPTWAYLYSDRATLMVGKADDEVLPEKQGVLFYVYCDDVEAKRTELIASGIQASEITKPFYSPNGKFRVADPDGYVLMIAHT